jgi:translation initiation factor 5A
MSNLGPTVPIQANQIKKGSLAVLKDRPCKIINVAFSKTGKHGHAKCHFHGADVFTDKKYEDICPSTHMMSQPVLDRTEYDLVNIDDDGYLTLMAKDGLSKNDLALPATEMANEIKEKFEAGISLILVVLSWGTVEELVISYKVGDAE